jgi:alpha-methylacyl-CoA racemase
MRIIELAGIGPTPFAGMMLSDLGAEVIRVDRVGGSGNPVASQSGPMERGKRTVAFDLKQPEGVEAVLRMVEASDGLFEGFRSGVAERLGVGPDVCLARNPKLVYGRMTGWGQSGPLADRAGHDINYISLAGPLAHIGRIGQPPSVPLNLIGDFGGGSVFLVLGMVAALLEVARGGDGQVVDAAMVDGAAYLLSPLYAAHASGFWTDDYGANFLDSGAYFYEVYGTADGKWLAVGAIEPQFHAEFIAGIGLADADDLPDQMDRDRWPEMKQRVGVIIAQRTLDEWVAVFDGTDACVTPVLSMGDTPTHPHALARDAFFQFGGVTQPRPAPRFEGTPSEPAGQSQPPGADTDALLAELGYSTEEVAALRTTGAVA